MARRQTKQDEKRKYLREYRRRERQKAAAVGLLCEQPGRVIAAYVPVPIVWRTTGFGTAAVIREKPDGRSQYGFVMLDLQRGGLFIPGVKSDLDTASAVAKCEELLKMDNVPPSEPGIAEQAGEFAFGAYAYALECGYSWPAELGTTLSIFPRPAGYAGDWLRGFQDRERICENLWDVIQNLPELTEDIPDDKDLIVFTSVTLAVPDAERLRSLLDANRFDFEFDSHQDDVSRYTVSRAKPNRSWNMLPTAQAVRQIIGTITVDSDIVTVEAHTLAFAAHILMKLIHLYGPGMEYKESSYIDPNRSKHRH